MNTATKTLKLKTNIKAGAISMINHNRALKVRAAVKAGAISMVNHNRALGL